MLPLLRRPRRSRHAGPVSILLVLASLLAGAAAPGAALAVEGLELSTPFPAVVVEPGGNAEFDIRIAVTEPRRVDLSVDGVPDGWSASFRGGGLVIDGVFVDPDEPPEVTLDVDVAEGATSAATLTVRAASGSLRETLQLDLRPAEAAAGDVTLEAEFAQLSGASDDTFTFNVDLNNDTPAEATFNISATGPQGWEIDARPSGQSQATTATVAAGGTQAINVEVDPPDDVAAQGYPILLEVSGDAGSASTELAVIIEGTYTLELSTPNDVLSLTANAGAPTEITFELTNSGTAPITNVEVTATPPTGWELAPGDPIPVIEPGATEQVTRTLTPSPDAIAGDYVVTVSAAGTEAEADVQLRVTVETSPLWGFVGIALIVAVLAGLFWVFRTYGRR